MNTQDNPDYNSVLEFNNPDPVTLNIVLKGSWQLQDTLPPVELVLSKLSSSPQFERISFSSAAVTSWDSGLLVFLSKLIRYCDENKLQVMTDGLPAGICNLLDLAASSPATNDISQHSNDESLLNRIGNTTIDLVEGAPDALRFLGASLKSVVRLVTGKAQYNKSEFFYIIQQVGPQALPIVSLISFLVGLILAYMGALQLERFGAQIYIADLVGIAMVREVGSLMTAIIMTGRTGAAYAAEIGTMQVNEEVDAFKTLGISPMDYLVMPRLVALVLMMPLLSLYAGLVGILAGIIISVNVFDLSVYEY